MLKLIKFGFAGVAGFLVDGGTLSGLLHFTPLDPYSARVIAIAVAMIATWLINRHLIFGPSQHSVAYEAARYGSVGLVGSLLNYTIYAAILTVLPQMGALFALVIASGCVAVFSWFGYSQLVFQRR
jgi:putative flippase GtrA